MCFTVESPDFKYELNATGTAIFNILFFIKNNILLFRLMSYSKVDSSSIEYPLIYVCVLLLSHV